jgi:gluconokinase
MANIGSFAIVPGVAALTIGTSGAIRVGNTTPTLNFKAMTFSYCLFENLFISGGPINNGGIALQWYARHVLKSPLQTPADYDALLDPIQQVNAGADGVLFLPYLLGERAPIWNSHASAVFMGLRNHHTQAHLTRAVVEGISMALYHILKSMEDSGLVVNKVHVSGGFVHSRTWLQILADIFNKEIHLIHEEDASAIGAAYLGLKWKRLIDDYGQLKPRTETSFIPNQSNHARYQQTFPIYERIYEKLRGEMQLLHQLQN